MNVAFKHALKALVLLVSSCGVFQNDILVGVTQKSVVGNRDGLRVQVAVKEEGFRELLSKGYYTFYAEAYDDIGNSYLLFGSYRKDKLINASSNDGVLKFDILLTKNNFEWGVPKKKSSVCIRLSFLLDIVRSYSNKICYDA